MIPNGIDPLLTPRCAHYTSEIIRVMQHSDQRKHGSDDTHFSKSKVLTSTPSSLLFNNGNTNKLFYPGCNHLSSTMQIPVFYGCKHSTQPIKLVPAQQTIIYTCLSI
jgi:hypothetical protein